MAGGAVWVGAGRTGLLNSVASFCANSVPLAVVESFIGSFLQVPRTLLPEDFPRFDAAVNNQLLFYILFYSLILKS